MFRSVFTKYITVFMMIIIISFIIQITIISTLIGAYSDSSKQVSLSTAADTFASYLTESFDSSRYKSLPQYVKNNRDTINSRLYMMLEYSQNMSIIAADTDGTVFFSTGPDVPFIPGDYGKEYTETVIISESVISSVTDDGYSFVTEDEGGIFSKVSYVYGMPVKDINGTKIGVIFACSSDTDMDSLLESLINTSIMSSLWIMLAALIAVYFISDRIISPLKNMSTAAKSFAAGNFDIRVPVSGHDEVAELASAFNNMANSLSNLEEMRSSFLANVSHDLRTPMTTISGFIDSILDGAIPPEKHKHYLSIVSEEVKRLSRLVNSLLDITRIQAGERKFNRINFDICELTCQIIISMESRLEKKNLNVEFAPSKDSITVNADRDAIYQILYNLCDNAVKFSRENGDYRISINIQGKKAVISVYNEGDGIPAEDLPYVFDRFYKSDKSRGLDKTGTGLGLYIVKTIIEAHGENIKVSSEQGKFCKFEFTLDLAQPQIK